MTELPTNTIEQRTSRDIFTLVQTVQPESIRVQTLGDRKSAMWGTIYFRELPFVFVAWNGVRRRQLPIPGYELYTTWWAHAPYNPSEFHALSSTSPLSVDELSQYLAANRESIPAASIMQYLRDNEEKYKRVEKDLDQNPKLRTQFGTAVSLVCNEKEGGHPQTPHHKGGLGRWLLHG